jgi:hypothetical protein
MNKKIISAFTLLSFIIFSISCYTLSTKEVKTVADWQGKKIKILSVIRTSGERIDFSKDNPGQIHGDSIVGMAKRLTKEVEINRDNIKVIKGHKKRKSKIFEIVDKDGKIYRVVTGTIREVKVIKDLTGEEVDKIRFSCEYESVSIPLTEVKFVRVKRITPGKTFLVVVAVAGGIGLAILAYMGLTLGLAD